MARPLLTPGSMNSRPTLTTRIKVTLSELLAKVRALLTPPPPLVPIRVRTDKDTDRWRNEGGH